MFTQHLERSSALQCGQGVKALLDSGKLRHTVKGLEVGPSQETSLATRSQPTCSIVCGAPWAGLIGAPHRSHVMLSLFSREGGESHRTRPGRREEPIYFLLSHFYHPPFRSVAPSCIFQRCKPGNIFRNRGN